MLSIGRRVSNAVPLIAGRINAQSHEIHQLTEDQAYASLRSSAQGISEQEALRRLQEYGPKRIEEIGKKRFLPSFIKEFTHFFA